MNNTTQTNNNKVTPINTDANFYYWMSKSINELTEQSNISKTIVTILVVWNIILTLFVACSLAFTLITFNKIKYSTLQKTTTNPELNTRILFDELIPPYGLMPIELEGE